MNPKLKNFIIIAAVAVISFPIMYLIVLFATGYASVDFGYDDKKDETKKELQMMERSSEIDSLIAKKSKSFQAMVKERARLRKERKKLEQMRQHIQSLQADLEAQKKDLEAKKKRLEQIVEKSDELSQEKIKELAKIYGSMDPEEAAAILQTLNNDLVIKILKAIRDERQKSDIVAALPNSKAAAISNQIGKPLLND